MAGVEHGVEVKAQPRQVLGIDLRQSKVDADAVSDQCPGGANRVGAGRGLDGAGLGAVHANDQRIKTALDTDDRQECLGGDVRRASGGQDQGGWKVDGHVVLLSEERLARPPSLIDTQIYALNAGRFTYSEVIRPRRRA